MRTVPLLALFLLPLAGCSVVLNDFTQPRNGSLFILGMHHPTQSAYVAECRENPQSQVECRELNVTADPTDK
jgi:hypothetical protein